MKTTPTGKSEWIHQLQEEAAREHRRTAVDLAAAIRKGEIVGSVVNLLFHTSGKDFHSKLSYLLELLAESYTKGHCGTDACGHILSFLVTFAVDLRSFLPYWVLSDQLAPEELEHSHHLVLELLEYLSARDVVTARDIHRGMREHTESRLRVEGLDAAGAAECALKLAGDTLSALVRNSVADLGRSNLFRAALACKKGGGTELGNDYAAFLHHFIRLGGSLVTTNPVLIKLAWELDLVHWNRRVDGLIAGRYTRGDLKYVIEAGEEALTAAIEEISSLVTMAVVEENCRLLRGIYLISEARQGVVSLQVNPRNHDDPQRMVAEARQLYGELKERLGGIPNVVFKLPATSAGKVAAEKLVAEGIGVTITVNFSLFQTAGFAEALQHSQAPVCYIALMNGRLANPVRDELTAVPGGADAARWAGVEVARKAQRLLYGDMEQGGLGLDRSKVRLLIASLRIYEDWMPDISELWGSPVITFFPNVRAAYDRHRREIKADAIHGVTPAAELELLAQSEIFRQAWWLPGDPVTLRPRRVLSLAAEDSLELIRWKPVAETIQQFIQLYNEMGALLRQRIESLQQN